MANLGQRGLITVTEGRNTPQTGSPLSFTEDTDTIQTQMWSNHQIRILNETDQ